MADSKPKNAVCWGCMRTVGPLKPTDIEVCADCFAKMGIAEKVMFNQMQMSRLAIERFANGMENLVLLISTAVDKAETAQEEGWFGKN